MNQAHLHLLFNHLPIIFPLAGLLLWIASTLTGSNPIKRSAYFIFILAALFTLAAMATGEGAEEVVEHLNGISKRTIHDHEEWAEKFALLNYLTGAISLLALWLNWRKNKIATMLHYLILVAVILSLGLGAKTGNSGGLIRHSEMSSNTATISNSQNEQEGD